MSYDKVKRGLHGFEVFLMYLDSLIELLPCFDSFRTNNIMQLTTRGSCFAFQFSFFIWLSGKFATDSKLDEMHRAMNQVATLKRSR